MINQENAREIVLDMLLEAIEEEKFSHLILSQTLKKHQNMEKQERAFITHIFQGTVKRYLTLDYIINQFSSLPVRKMKPLIRNLLRMSVYQIFYMNQVPISAVCNEAVKIAKHRNFSGLSGFVNGVLRNIARNVDNIKYPDKATDSVKYLSVMYSFPEPLVQQMLQQYDFDIVERMLAASLKEKETTIRCNLNKLSPVELKGILEQEGVKAEVSEYLDYAFHIKDYDYLDKLDSFRNGLYTIQDVSSMLVCEVAGIRKSDYVIDVCAAPGGKALHAATLARKVSARDLTPYKVGLIQENIERLGITNIEAMVWDAKVPDDKSLSSADVLIADLPCSGLGVLGKKSDIKYRLTQNQQKELVQLQREILSVVQGYVKKGGFLIYSTCTVNREENEENRDWFLKHFDFQAESLDAYLPEQLRSETTKKGYLQLLQGIHGTDGFFIAKFRRN